MKKIFFGLVLAFISILLLAGSFNFCLAQTDPEEENADPKAAETGDEYIATIDIATVYALHPAMQYYDQKISLFIKPPKQGTSYDEFLNVMKSRRSDFKKSFEGNSSEIKRLKGEIDALKPEIQKLDSRKAIEAAPVNEKYDPQISQTTNEVEKKNFITLRTEELKKIETKYNEELERKTKTLLNLLDSYEKIQRSLLKVYYITPEETAKKFEEINQEIKDIIKLAAKKKGIKAVINHNYFFGKDENKKPAEKSVEDKTRSNSELEELLARGPDYSKALRILRSLEPGLSKEIIITRNPEFSEAEYVKMLQKMNKDQEKEEISRSYHSKDYIMHLDQLTGMTTTPVFYGGTDLTWLTVIAIMVKNGIPKEKAEMISEVILNSSSLKSK